MMTLEELKAEVVKRPEAPTIKGFLSSLPFVMPLERMEKGEKNDVRRAEG